MTKTSPRFTLAALAFTAIVASPAAGLAADYAPPPAPELRHADWSGPYLGGFGAVSCMETHYIPSTGPDPDLNGCGYMGGVLAGWNFQLGDWVLGLEGDAGWGGHNAENSLDAVDYNIDMLSTVRGRVGFLATDQTLFYATGGVGWLKGEMDALVGPASLPGSDSKTHFGWLIGGGIEHAFTNFFHARLEYLYGSFEDKTYDLSVATCAPTPCFADLDFEELHMVRLALTFHLSDLFNRPAADAPVYKP